MRLFVSVEPSPAARAALAGRLAAVDLGAARLIPADLWHVTLAFLGEVADGHVTDLRPALARVAATANPLSLRLSSAGVFPSVRRSAVLWIGLGGDVAALQVLAGDVVRAVGQTGVRLERRAFAAHLTVARYRQPQPAAAQAAIAALAEYVGPPFDVAEIHLMRSHLGPRPRHEQIDRWALGGTRRAATTTPARPTRR
ncbi:MAG: RNA 2',3'-cyclic phosphodiesterase [Actinomycetota bacterium]|nr:RNA 2',3'-cyclic phosphodiesterase [Actinomycetota bacterium]